MERISQIVMIIGVGGIVWNRKNIIIILMSIELILLAVNMNLIGNAVEMDDIKGQVFAIYVLTVAAAESAIGLAILVVYYRVRGTIEVEKITRLKG